MDEVRSDDPPDAIGPYRILRVLGEGAMGVVYLAEQTEPLRRQVALKVLKPGMDSAQVVARFESERQALAVMEHPGIARVFDAGRTAAGLPYFAMERVDGVPITRWCDERRLDVRSRVRLLAHVCAAIQHAHQKGVIHRDLKPSNVLVAAGDDGEPRVKVIDFGIARAVEPVADAIRLTAVDQSIGTPAYMSPEQATGSSLDIDTRTDIYSLGVLLYELLAGALPFDDRAYHGLAFLAHHLEKEPPRPSARFARLEDAEAIAHRRRTRPETLRRELAGDLDWIVLKALEKDRDRRYETPSGLASDLHRFLDSEPVAARPPSRSYRARKFVRRHRAGVAAAAAFILLLAGFGASMSVQARRIASARDVAETRRTQAEGLIDFMLGDLRSKLEPIGRLSILDDVGAEAIAYFATLPESEFSDEELLNRSRALEQIGRIRLDEGQPAEAGEALAASLRLARELSERDPADTQRLFQLSQSHFWVGYAAWLRDDLETAETRFRSYLEAAERLVELAPENLDYRLEVGFALSNLGSVREARGDLDGAGEAFRATLETKRDLVRRDSTRVDWLGELAETHNTLAVVYRRQGRYQAALQEHQQELDLKRRVLELEPEHAYWRYRLAYAHHFLGLLQNTTGHPDLAVRSGRRAVAVLDSLTSYDPDNAAWKRSHAAMRQQLGLALAGTGRTEDALGFLRSAQAELEALVRGDSTAVEWQEDLGRVRDGTARVLLHAGRDREALPEAIAAVEILSRLDPEASALSRRRAASAELTLGRALQAMGRGQEAEPLFDGVLKSLRGTAPSGAGVELRPLRAEAFLVTGDSAAARDELAALEELGYADPLLLALLRPTNAHGGQPAESPDAGS